MTDDALAQHRQDWIAAHARLIAAAAAKDTASLATAADTLAALKLSLAATTGEYDADEYAFHDLENAGFEGACAIATELLTGGEIGPARRLLAVFPGADAEHRVLCALEAGDPELALVQQGELPESGLTPSLQVHWALIRELSSSVAKALSSTKERILIGLSAFTNATYGEFEEYAAGDARAKAWIKSLLLSDDPDVRTYAIAQMCSRRSLGEHGPQFVEFGGRYVQIARGVRDAETVIAALFRRAHNTAPPPNGPTKPMTGAAADAMRRAAAIAEFELESGFLGLLDPPSEPFGYAQLAINGARVGRWRVERIDSEGGPTFLIACHESTRRAPGEAGWLERSGLVEARSGRLAIVDRMHRVDDAVRQGKGALIEVPSGFRPECFVSYADAMITAVGVALHDPATFIVPASHVAGGRPEA